MKRFIHATNSGGTNLNTGFDLDAYLTKGVEDIIQDAFAASLKNPKETVFLLSYALAAKRAASARKQHAAAEEGTPAV